ncbi:hypothetical protein [Comamonas serinivorans]|uniref:hypothetical protein n=1 Tax=Comamonas serinivorans TaxID=1082851 RepID=UPI0012F8158F|nr:hypothetical protein [Comamonas serinivorans]
MVHATIQAGLLGQSASQRILARLAHDTSAAMVHAQDLSDTQREAIGSLGVN